MRTFGRIAVILLLVAIIGGVGYGVWNSGYDQGVVDAADSTTQIVVREGHRGGFFPFGAIFGFFFLLLIFKFAFGWRRWGGGQYYGRVPGGYRAHMEDRMSHWHDEAHRNQRPSGAPSDAEGPIS